MKKFKNSINGITLVALVITIIILLILATISIQSLTNTGLFKKALEAKEKTKAAEINQAKILNEYEEELNKYVSGNIEEEKDPIKKVANKVLNSTENTLLKDKNGNKIVIPAGFKIISDNTTNNATTVDKGIVIEDSTSGITAGSQFVWIPIGEIIKEDGTKSTISLNRYTFDNDGNPTVQNNSIIDNYYQELDSSNKGNVVAKSISNFKSSVSTNGGFYIGRYEARTSKARASSEDALTPITEIGTEYVYYFITQPQAANLAQNMYNTSTFTSDLINSYAWDTTTLFLQNCSANKKYSTKVSINNIFAPKGTNNINENDIVCNIYDISSNIGEWTTETSSNENAPCTRRGGDYGSNDYYITSIRDSGSKSHNNPYVGFRPILYINN